MPVRPSSHATNGRHPGHDRVVQARPDPYPTNTEPPVSAQIQDALLLSLASIAVGMLAGAALSHWWREVARPAADMPASAAPVPKPTGFAAATTATPMARTPTASPLPARRLPASGATATPAPGPASRRAGGAAVRSAQSPPPLPQAADLLLVDDSAVARAKLRRLFEPQGYVVHLARDGVEALALLAKGRYAMLITDLEMPNMDGVELIHTCLAQPATARLPILAISGHESLRAKFNECSDICGIHRKPWVDDILLSHVAALVGTRRLQAVERVA